MTDEQQPAVGLDHRLGDLYGYDARAAALVGEAHKRPAMRLDGPAVTLHLAFWPSGEDPLSEADELNFKIAHAAWTRRLNTLAFALQRPAFGWRPDNTVWVDRFELMGEGASNSKTRIPSADESTEEPDRPLKTHESVISFAINWRGLEGAVQLERHTEYATLTVALHLGEDVSALTAAIERRGDNGAAAALAPRDETAILQEGATRAQFEAALAALHVGGWLVKDEAPLRRAGDALYLHLWHAFAESLSEQIAAIPGLTEADEVAESKEVLEDWNRRAALEEQLQTAKAHGAEPSEIDPLQQQIIELTKTIDAFEPIGLWDPERGISRGLACGASAMGGRLPGAVFCDLRGVALCERMDPGAPSEKPEEGAPSPLPAAAAVEPEQEGVPEPRAPAEEQVVFCDEEMRDLLERSRRLIGAAVGGPSIGQRELAANAFLNGRCVFVGNLGSLSRRPVDLGATQEYWSDDTDPKTVKREIALLDQYRNRVARHLFIFKQQPNSIQFGRLVERFHAVETVRLAAFRDLDLIRDSGRQLRQIGKRLEALEAETVTNLGDLKLRVFSEKVERLSDDVANLGVAATGGLAYRISRSAFYAGIFDRRLEEFNPTPIATWQPYAEFLRRRVVQTMNYISQVAVRRKNLQDRIGIQLSTVGTAGIKVNTKAILEVNQSIAKLSNREYQLEKRAELSRQATDRLSQIAAVLGAATLGANLGDEYLDLLVDVPGKIEGALIGAALGLLVAVIIRLARPEKVRPDDEETSEKDAPR